MLQLESLKNLRPETVVGIKDVPFTVLAEALPGVIEASYSIDEVASTDADADFIDVAAQLNLSPDTEERMVVTDRYIVAGGLVYAAHHDCDNPLESGCANGAIYHRRSDRGNRTEQSRFLDACGLNGDGEPDLAAEAVSDELALHVTATIQQNKALMTMLCDVIGMPGAQPARDVVFARITDAIGREGWEFAKDYIADSFLGIKWWVDVPDAVKDNWSDLVDLLTESEAESAWDRANVSGKIGNPLALPISIYEHSGVSYRIDSTRDVSSCDAVWVPDDEALENLQSKVLHDLGFSEASLLSAGWDWYEAVQRLSGMSGALLNRQELDRRLVDAARPYAKSVVEEFNSWVSGDVHGVVVYVIDRATGERISDLDEESFGYLGSQYAEEELEAIVLAKALQCGQSVHGSLS
jgi:hypothetical protein